MMGTQVSSLFLYGPGAFYFYPWKPIFQFLSGDSYQVGYKFFRRDHSNTTNLSLHCVALVWQLLGNFGFLLALDDTSLVQSLGSGLGLDGLERPLSALTAILWIGTQLLNKAPWQAKIMSSSAIAGV